MLLSYACLFAGIVVGVIGQILLKTGAVRSADTVNQFLNPFTVGGLVVYGFGALFYIVAIKRIPVSIAFPSVSLSYIAVAVCAHYMWNEPLGWAQVGGIVLIGGGVLLLHTAAGDSPAELSCVLRDAR
jgi:drug/metabolite transporter (DMT)-like permease